MNNKLGQQKLDSAKIGNKDIVHFMLQLRQLSRKKKNQKRRNEFPLSERGKFFRE